MPKTAAETRDPFEGTKYKSLRRLDAGEMGEVHLVEHRHLGRTFVAKIPHVELTAHPQVVDRLRLEAQALGQLNHPNIVTVTDFGKSADGRPFLVLQHLEGRTLRAELDARRALPPSEAVAYTLALLSGLGAAHALGIVHRDVKPDNLFLALQPNGQRTLKILDFGIARVLPDAPSAAPRPLALPTESGAVIGTPRFLSPEAATGVRVDTRADLYCAALVFYIMLAGRGPFDHVVGREGLMQAHASATPAPPSRYATQPIPPELDELLLTALAKDPASRFQNAEAFAEAVESVARAAGFPPVSVDVTTAAVGSARAPDSSARAPDALRPPVQPLPASMQWAASNVEPALNSGHEIDSILSAAVPTGVQQTHSGPRMKLVLWFAVSAILSALAAAALVGSLLARR